MRISKTILSGLALSLFIPVTAFCADPDCQLPAGSDNGFHVRDTNKVNEQASMVPAWPMQDANTDPSIVLQADKIQINQVRISWKPMQDNLAESYELQRSPDGVIWQTLQTRFKPTESSLDIPFQFTDAEPDKPVTHYRLKITMPDGSEKCSKMSVIEFLDQSSVSVLPNPANRFAYMQLYTLQGGKAQLFILDNKGKIKHLETISVRQGNNEIYLGMLKKIGKGVFTIKVVLNEEEILTSSLVVLQ